MEIIMKAENLTKDFGKEHVLKGITLTIYENTFTAILGPSGSGKKYPVKYSLRDAKAYRWKCGVQRCKNNGL